MLCRITYDWHRHHTLDCNQKNDDMRKFTFLFYHYQTLINWVCNCKNSLKYNISGLKHEHAKIDTYLKRQSYLKNRLCLSKGLDAKLIISICFDNKHNLLEKNVFVRFVKSQLFPHEQSQTCFRCFCERWQFK